MSHETCWTLIRAAGAGDPVARSDFAGRYLPVVRSALAARWHGTPLLAEVDDAAQEVFVECFRVQGALHRATPGRGDGFRSFLFGVVRNVALHAERARARQHAHGVASAEVEHLPADEDSCATAFDRAWARQVMREAADLQVRTAQARGAAAMQRAEILRLRFHEGLPIRDIAKLWAVDPARLHHDYAVARDEFAAALRAVVADHLTEGDGDVDRECTRLLALLA